MQNKELNEKKIELVKTLARIRAGREKNLKKGKFIRREIAQMMTKMKGEAK